MFVCQCVYHITLSPPTCTELTIEDLEQVYEAVYDASPKWFNIGLALKVPVPTLERIEKKTNDLGAKLREMLMTWLQTNTEATWQDIVGALSRKTVGFTTLAKEIGDGHAAIDKQRMELKQVREKVEEQQQTIQQLSEDLERAQQPPMKPNPIQDMGWQEPSKSPEVMFRGSATSDSNVAYFNGRGSKKIHSYNSDTQKWDQRPIPDTPLTKHTLVIVNAMLTIVGGFCEMTCKAANSILSLTPDGRNTEYIWSSKFPNMPSERFNTTAVCCGHSLIVAGGFNGAQILTVVEVLNTDARQWSTASPLPYPFSSASASICGETLYVLGGYIHPNKPTRLVLTCSIPELLKSSQMHSPTIEPIWKRVVDSPYYFSSCATLYGELYLVGGFDKISNAETADIRTYSRRTDSWHTIALGKMPATQYRALVVTLRDKLMVVGGLVGPGLITTEKDQYWGIQQDSVNVLY